METNQDNEFLTQFMPHPMHSTGSNFLSKCSTISTASYEVPWACVSKFHLLGENVFQCPVCHPSSLQTLLVHCLGQITPNLSLFQENTKQKNKTKLKTLTLTIHVLPVCHGTVICVILRVLLKQLSRVVALPSLLIIISPNSTFSRYWANLISGKMKMKERGLGRNYGS